MQVQSIAECSEGSILQYFRPSFSYHLSLRSVFCLFLSGRIRQVLLYLRLMDTTTPLVRLVFRQHIDDGFKWRPVIPATCIYKRSLRNILEREWNSGIFEKGKKNLSPLQTLQNMSPCDLYHILFMLRSVNFEKLHRKVARRREAVLLLKQIKPATL